MTEELLLKQLKKNPFVLAPMAGITNCAFRSFMKEMGASFVITELVSANGLKHSSERTKKIMKFSESQRPVGIQIFGENLDFLSEAALICEQMGADFVDLNFGCPVPKVVKRGAGSAVLKNLNQMTKVIRATKRHIQIPLTIKIRTGWDEDHRNADQVCHIAYNEGVTWVAIHGRTRSKGYSGQADWEYIREVKENALLPIIGNGDLIFAKQAVKALKDSKCEGVMIGRGCLKNPWIFQECLNLWEFHQKNLNVPLTSQCHAEVLDRLYESLVKESESRVVGVQLKKLSSWLSSGYPDSALFRREIFQIKDVEKTYECAKQYFVGLKGVPQRDTSHESFLMGGHG